MIEPSHLSREIIHPVLESLALHRDDAARLRRDGNLLLGTACAESDCGRWLRQHGNGPALGIFQMEAGMTGYEDIWVNYLSFRPALSDKVLRWATKRWANIPGPEEMIGNHYFAAAMARIKYLRDPAPIPDTLHGQASYWKRVYNSPLGAHDADWYLSKWDQFVGRGGWV